VVGDKTPAVRAVDCHPEGVLHALKNVAGLIVQVAAISCFLATTCHAAGTLYAQELIRQALSHHHNAVALLIHAKRSSDQEFVAIAVDGVRTIRSGDRSELGVLSSGITRVEPNTPGGQIRIEEALKNVSGDTIGVLTALFPYPEHPEAGVELRTAVNIQSELSARLSDEDNLFQPYPYNPTMSDETYAQALLFKTMAQHPEALILAMHVVPPGHDKGLIIACNVGRIGMASEDGDMGVINTGKTTFKAMLARSRVKVQLVMQDEHGKTVGALSEFFRYDSGATREHYEAMARVIRDELKSQIHDKDALFRSSYTSNTHSQLIP
jgi:hypothetical protein